MLRIVLLATSLLVSTEAKSNSLTDYSEMMNRNIDHHSQILERRAFNTPAIQCLARNVYYEARGESILGQIAIINVTMNRAGSVNQICRTVYQPGQFSWTERPQRHPGGDPWQRALVLAWLAINDSESIRDLTHGSQYFHSYRNTPPLYRRFEYVVTLGNHRFYRHPQYIELAEAR